MALNPFTPLSPLCASVGIDQRPAELPRPQATHLSPRPNGPLSQAAMSLQWPYSLTSMAESDFRRHHKTITKYRPTTTTKPLSAIERLPHELKVLVMKHVPDAGSLKNLLLSGPMYYNTFTWDESKIVTSVIYTQMPDNIMPELIFTLHTQRWSENWSIYSNCGQRKVNSICELLDRITPIV